MSPFCGEKRPCEERTRHHEGLVMLKNIKFHEKNIKFDPKWVAMAPFGAFLAGNDRHGPPGAIGTPPGPPNG